MLKTILSIIAFLFIFFFSTSSLADETVFYVLRNQTPDRMTPFINTLNSLKKNYKKIDILIPQAYNIDESGTVNKGIEPDILNFAVQHSMKIMPLVTNAKFSREGAHQFLLNTPAQIMALDKLIQICKDNHFYGIQLDFEMVHKEDKDNLTQFYTLAAKKLHANGLVISFAVAPIVTDQPDSLFLQKIYENWEGAYDLKKIGEAADFVSIMTYNQHGGRTTPGSTANLPWIKQAILYALKSIPSHKISLGIADYSTHWYTGSVLIDNTEKIAVKMRGISYEEAMRIVHENKKKLIWDEPFAISYVIFDKNWLNEYIFVEDAKSFAERYALVNQYKLRGISVFDLGTEDPRIWEQIGH